MRTITLELLRHGAAHNQLLSRLTNYLALCGNHGAQTLQVPFNHNQLLHRLHVLGYHADERSRQFQLEDTAEVIGELLGGITGLTAELSRGGPSDHAALHLRLVVSASELALLPFELADAPHGFPGASQPLLLQNQLPLCLTREVRRTADPAGPWPGQPKVLFVAAQPAGVGSIPLEAHLLALRRALEPWVNSFENEQVRLEQVSEYLTVLPEATIDDLQRACQEDEYTHVHILAHGVRYQKGENYRFGLALHPRQEGEEYEIIDGPRLATVLRAMRQPPGRTLTRPAVVTLACCEGGNVGSVAGAGASVAHALHTAGIVMVVASQFPLTFAGSVVMVELLYGGMLDGMDPRFVLNNLRRQLRVRQPGSHDWASIVAYASLPPDFERQLSEVQLQRARGIIDGVLKATDRLASRLSSGGQMQRNDDARRETSFNVAEGFTRLPADFLQRYLRKIQGVEHRLHLLLETEDARQSEIYGLLARTKKREAYIHYYLRRYIDAPANSAVTQANGSTLESLHALGRSLDYYERCMHAGPQGSWPLHQVLSLSLVLGRRGFRHGEIWLQCLGLARTSSEFDPKYPSDWAHTDLLELYLLACDTSRWEGGEVVRGCLESLHPSPMSEASSRSIAAQQAAFHAQALVEKLGYGSPAVEATVRQLDRYRDWYNDERWFRDSLLGNISAESEYLLHILQP